MTEPTGDPIEALLQAYPRLFRGVRPEVISGLPTGWRKLVATLLSYIDAAVGERADDFHVLQIKEEFGRLRFYWRLAGEESAYLDNIKPWELEFVRILPPRPSKLFSAIEVLVDRAALDSGSICKACGADDATRGGEGRLSVLCDSCRALPIH